MYSTITIGGSATEQFGGFYPDGVRDCLYTSRKRLNSPIFILSVSGSVLIAWITIGYKSVKAAMTNPADVLKYK